jgi:serine/threonine protein kinase/Flp pilus assembly protein TadD
VLRLLEDYLASLERGVPLRPEELLAQHPDLAQPLREYLASLEFLHRAALNLHSSEPASKAGLEPEVVELGQLGDFRLLREIGRGGMGVVYEAEQVSLSRRVALKVLPFAAPLDSKQLQRFKNEAQAAAHLHHANIVPVFGVGCERGVHYYAMQFIEGLTLAAVIRELRENVEFRRTNDEGMPNSRMPKDQRRNHDESKESDHLEVSALARTGIRHSTLEILSSFGMGHSSFFRTAANLGLQAAEALEHAHELGIVHRDIKPANLLVDERGNLWITDFGLAHCQSQIGLTLSGDLVGTLRYMSPEQALGKRGLVDHRADVYSLGVTLHELLTLEPAFSGIDREEVLRQIAFEEPRPPRQRNKAIPRELETIVLKAIEKTPDGRYATAKELADDLRRFLEDKPIRASRPTLAQRAAKWSRRHRSVVWAGLLLLVTALIGSGVATLLIARQRDAADANYQLAKENLDTAYEILNDYVVTAENRLTRGKELTPEEHRLLEKMLAFYGRIAQENSRDPSVRLKTAKAFRRIASVQEILGQAKQALAAYQQALDISKKLSSEFPHDPEFKQDLAQNYSSLGGVFETFLYSGRRAEVEKAHAEALRIQEQLVEEFPANLDYLHDLGLTHARLGYMRLYGGATEAGAGPLAEAELHVRRALAIREQLVQAKPKEFIYRQQLGGTLGNYADLLMATGEFQEAEKIVRRELELRRKLADEHPDALDARDFLADAYMNVAQLRDCRGQFQEAAAALREELRIRKMNAAENPGMWLYLTIVARSHRRLGDALRRSGAQEESMAAYNDAIAVCKEVIGPHPDCADAYILLGQALSRTGAKKEAVAAWEQVFQHGRDKAQAANSVARAFATSLDLRLQNREEAVHLTQAVQLAQKAVDLVPESGWYWNTLGAACYRAGQWKDAVEALENSMQLRSGGDGADWFLLAMAHQQLDQWAEARMWYDRAVPWMDKYKPYDEELCGFRAEAAALLGMAEKPGPK